MRILSIICMIIVMLSIGIGIQGLANAQTAPVAGFTTNVTSGYVPLTVQFTDTSSGNPSAWSWDFGDGNTSILHNPVHTYSVPGTFRVVLTASNSNGNSSATRFITMNGLVPFTNNSIVTMEQYQASSLDYQTDNAYDTASQEPVQMCYETLFSYNGSGVITPVPELATGYDVSPDGLVYTIYLRPNVTFHDGTAFNASAVKYSLDRLFLIDNGEAYGNFQGTVKGFTAYNNKLSNTTQTDVNAYLAAGGVQVINDTCVQITLESPNSNFIRMLTFSACSIMSPSFDQGHGGYDAINHTGNPYLVNHECGTGPFTVGSFNSGHSITLDRFNNYWKGPAASAHIILLEVDDWNSRLQELESGDADFISVDMPHAPLVAGVSGVSLVSFPGLNVGAVTFNYNVWPWNILAVRKAFSESFNQSLYLQTVTNGYGTPLSAPIPLGVVGGDQNYSSQKFDPADAEQLLVSAGFTPANKTNLTITYNVGNTNRQLLCQMLADQVNSYQNVTGLHVNVQGVDWVTYFAGMNNRTLPFGSMSWQADYPGTDNFVSTYLYSQGYYMKMFNDPGNATADSLFQQSLREADPTKQASLYKQIVDIVNIGYPYIYTYQSDDLFAYNNNVTGVVYNPLNGGVYVNYYTVYKTLNASFTANTTIGNAPLTVQFNDTSRGSPSSWNWSFGDGSGNLTTRNVTHTFSSAGNYTVMLTVTNGTKSSTASSPVTVTAPIVPTASIVSYSIPGSMVSGQSYQCSVTMKNTGTKSWTSSDAIGLGALYDSSGSAAKFGATRFYVPSGTTVSPGSSYTFNFTLTAPAAGTYYPAWEMVWEGHQWFGQQLLITVNVAPAASTPDAQIVSYSIPGSMTSGQSYSCSVTMKNTGTKSWSSGDPISLGALYDSSGSAAKFGSTRFNLPSGTTVSPGSSYTFNFTLTAPAAGTYYPAWEMVWEGHQWFGQTLVITVNVAPAALTPDAQIVSYSIPGSMIHGHSYACNVTVKNSGTKSWNSTDLIGLGALYDSSGSAAKFGSTRFYVPSGTTVSPGNSYTFSFTLTAPAAGTYYPAWEMVWDGHQWFGQQLIITINVT